MLKIKSFNIPRFYYFRISILITVFVIALFILKMCYPVQNDIGWLVFKMKSTKIQLPAFRPGHIYPSRGDCSGLANLFIDEYRLWDQKLSEKNGKNLNSTECFKKNSEEKTGAHCILYAK